VGSVVPDALLRLGPGSPRRRRAYPLAAVQASVALDGRGPQSDADQGPVPGSPQPRDGKRNGCQSSALCQSLLVDRARLQPRAVISPERVGRFFRRGTLRLFSVRGVARRFAAHQLCADRADRRHHLSQRFAGDAGARLRPVLSDWRAIFCRHAALGPTARQDRPARGALFGGVSAALLPQFWIVLPGRVGRRVRGACPVVAPLELLRGTRRSCGRIGRVDDRLVPAFHRPGPERKTALLDSTSHCIVLLSDCGRTGAVPVRQTRAPAPVEVARTAPFSHFFRPVRLCRLGQRPPPARVSGNPRGSSVSRLPSGGGPVLGSAGHHGSGQRVSYLGPAEPLSVAQPALGDVSAHLRLSLFYAGLSAPALVPPPDEWVLRLCRGLGRFSLLPEPQGRRFLERHRALSFRPDAPAAHLRFGRGLFSSAVVRPARSARPLRAGLEGCLPAPQPPVSDGRIQNSRGGKIQLRRCGHCAGRRADRV
jgi:hypothetical protein